MPQGGEKEGTESQLSGETGSGPLREHKQQGAGQDQSRTRSALATPCVPAHALS